LLVAIARRGSGRLLATAPARANGLPAIVVRLAQGEPRDAQTLLLQAEVGADGLIRRVFAWIAPDKLGALA
jgi:hypothetical protein